VIGETHSCCGGWHCTCIYAATMALNVPEREHLGISTATGRASCSISGVRVWIDYGDERGYQSSGIIRPIRYSRSYDGREFLRSWCESRQSERTFRVDRIILVDPTIGVVAPREHAAPSIARTRYVLSEPEQRGCEENSSLSSSCGSLREDQFI
jgi:hypothetical protein